LIKFEKFRKKHISETAEVSYNEYIKERENVNILPKNDYKEYFVNLLKKMYDHGLGITLYEDRKMRGFLTCYGPIDNFFGSSKGIFIPLHGHGVLDKNKDKIYSLLYQKAAEKWYRKDLLSHAVTIYTHSSDVLNSFFYNGFGMRCIDAISSLDNKKLNFNNSLDADYNEIDFDELDKVQPLKNKLIKHLADSPTFLIYKKYGLKKFVEQSKKRGSRFFTVDIDNETAGYIEIMARGENFSTTAEDMTNICGAYLQERFRGEDYFQNLLYFMFEKLKREGYKRCGVDFESFNPLAYRFWTKYFEPYTHTLTRRIDEKTD